MSKRGSAAAPGSATKKAKSNSVSLDISEVVKGNTNTEYYANLAAAYNKVLDHPLFEDILDQKPLSITAGAGSGSGHEAPFCQKAFATAMAEKGHYKCGFNIMSINWLWSATPRVPIRLGAIRNLERHYFATPGVFPGEIVIAMDSAEDKPLQQCGQLRVLSPEEPRAALLNRIAERIQAGAGDDELSAWRAMLLSVTAHFKMATSVDDLVFESMQLREHLVVDYQAMARTGRQWCYLIHQIHADSGGNVKEKDLADHIRNKVTLSDSTEAITDNFIRCALGVHKQLLGCKELVALIETSEDTYGQNSPYNSVAKLHLFSQKLKSTDSCAWVFASINDACASGMYPPCTFTVRSLKGEASNKGFIDVMLFKSEIRAYMLSEYLDKRAFASAAKEKIRAVFSNHATYRTNVGFPEQAMQQELSWQNNWPPSTMQAFKLIEDLVFGREFDTVLRGALRRGKSAAEVLELERVCDLVSQIDEDLAAEKQPAEAPILVEDADNDNVDDDVTLDIVEARGATLDNQTKVELAKFRAEATRMSQTLRFVTEPKSSAQVTTEILQSEPEKGDDADAQKWTVVLYDTPVSGESITNPRTRKPPLRAHYAKMMRGAVDAVSQAGPQKTELRDKVIFIVSNGGKEGNFTKYMEVFMGQDSAGEPASEKSKPARNGAKSIERSVATLTLVMDEESLTERRERSRGLATVDQLEQVYFVTKDALQVEKRKRLKYPGSTAGNTLGPVILPAHDSMWRATFADKKSILGSARVAVGGRTEGYGRAVGDDGLRGNVKPRAADQMEPVFFHSKGNAVWEEYMHMLGGPRCIRRVVDLTPSDGVVAMWACLHRIPFLGFMFTDAHGSHLRKHLANLIFEAMHTEGSKLYKSTLAVLIASVGKSTETQADGKKGAANPKPGTEPEANAKKGEAKVPKALQEALKANKSAKGSGKASGKKAKTAGKDPKKDDEEDEDSEPTDSFSDE